MKDFKKMPKMACGGGVKKYADGGDVVADYKAAIKSGNVVDRMPKPERDPGTNPYLSRVLGVSSDTKYEDRMPKRIPTGKVNIGGERMDMRPPKITENGAMLLKKGGKVKRGNKKK